MISPPRRQNCRAPMRITIIGGSQGTGARLAEAAVAAGHDVTVLSHSGGGPSGVTAALGDATEPGPVREAIVGVGAVVVTVGGAGGHGHVVGARLDRGAPYRPDGQAGHRQLAGPRGGRPGDVAGVDPARRPRGLSAEAAQRPLDRRQGLRRSRVALLPSARPSRTMAATVTTTATTGLNPHGLTVSSRVHADDATPGT